jgi:hypothetical protein
MGQSFDMQLILVVAIVLVAIVTFGYLVYSRIAALGLLRDDFDRRAPWLALGVILGGAFLYYSKF